MSEANDRADELQEMRRAREAIDQQTQQMRADIQERIDTARERAWMATNEGVVIGEGADRLYSDPLRFEAPKVHPVWADALRYELRTLRAIGEAGTVETRAYERDYVKWPRAHVLERFQERVGTHAEARDITQARRRLTSQHEERTHGRTQQQDQSRRY
jgi:hypothetical protein